MIISSQTRIDRHSISLRAVCHLLKSKYTHSTWLNLDARVGQYLCNSQHFLNVVKQFSIFHTIMAARSDDNGKDNQSDDSHSSKDSGAEDTKKEMLNFLLEKLSLNRERVEPSTEADKELRLRELSLDGVVDYIQSEERKPVKIITMAGAGISTSAGIPDFRSPNSGIYHNLEKYNLPHPQAIFEVDFFLSNPEPFFTLARDIFPEGFKPTLSHYFIRLLWEKGLLLRHYTQNIDTLERMAGVPSEKLVEAHGSFDTSRCLKCKAPYDYKWMKAKIKDGGVPKCDECKEGVVKPNIVLYGETLPGRFYRLVDEDFGQADLLIVMGSSLVVEPFASLIHRVRPNCPRLLINNEKVGEQDRMSRLLGIKSDGFNFGTRNPNNSRDVALIGDCDSGCQILADKLGWGEELRALMKREHERLDADVN